MPFSPKGAPDAQPLAVALADAPSVGKDGEHRVQAKTPFGFRAVRFINEGDSWFGELKTTPRLVGAKRTASRKRRGDAAAADFKPLPTLPAAVRKTRRRAVAKKITGGKR